MSLYEITINSHKSSLINEKDKKNISYNSNNSRTTKKRSPIPFPASKSSSHLENERPAPPPGLYFRENSGILLSLLRAFHSFQIKAGILQNPSGFSLSLSL